MDATDTPIMKKLLAILCFAAASVFGQGYGGAGTFGDPWLIPNVTALDSIREGIDGSPHWYEQTADIDLSGFNGGVWVPMGYLGTNTEFQGGFDGGGYTISNLVITDAEMTEYGNDWHAGLFGMWEHTTAVGDTTERMKNIHLVNVTITLTVAIGSGAADDTWVGSLVGQIHEVGSGTALIDSCTATNVNIQTAGNRTHEIGGLIGAAPSGLFELYQCAVIGPDTVIATGTTDQHYVGGLIGRSIGGTITECYVTDVYIYANRAAVRLGGFAGSIYTGGAVADCYAYNVVVVDNATSSSGTIQSGPFVGLTNVSDIERTYVKGTITFNAVADTNGWGGTGSGAGEDNFWDITINPAVDDITNNTGSYVIEGMPTDSMKTEGTFTWKNWDFDDIWEISPGVNDGYPFLDWAAAFTNPILNHPDSSGIYLIEGDTVLTHWTASDDTLITEQYVHYSTNSGSDWILIDTVDVADTSYSWVIPHAPTTAGGFRISSDVDVRRDSSANDFTILVSSSLDIIYPIEKTGVSIFPGDTIHVNVESQFVENIWYWWSNDSTNWSFLDSTAVDTTNGQYLDTTTYVWTFDGTVSGPEVWVRVEEQADTNLYVFNEEYLEMGWGFPLGYQICQTASGGLVEQLILYDPSCGWNSNVTWRYYVGILDDAAESRSWTYNSCPAPHTDPSCVYPRATPVYLIDGSDTTATYMDTFYGAPAATVTYRGRLYYMDGDTLLCNDLINDIDSIFVSDLSPLFGTSPLWVDDSIILQVYQVQRSKISGEYFASTYSDWESLNDSWFEPKILIGTDAFPLGTVSIDALPYPNNADPANDTQKILTGSVFGRFHFRGIHPKIIKTQP